MYYILLKTVPIGFGFGIVFSLIFFFGGFPFSYSLLASIPFITAALCGLGAIIAALVNNFLTVKGYTNNKVIYGASFLAAATVNSLIAMLTLDYFELAILQKEVVISILLGLGMGAVYGIYRFQVDSLNERMRFLEELAEKNQQLQVASRRLAITEERNRMGRELHDSIAQGLHGIVFSVHSLHNELKDPPQRVAAILNHMEATASSTLDELRAMIEELKPSLLAERGLEEAIQTTSDLFSQRQEIPVELKLELPATIPPELEMTIYRIIQEALANIEKHAAAQQVKVSLAKEGQELLLAISDNGKGFNVKEASPGNGLKNIGQRVDEAGGSLQLISKVGLGTSIIAKFPLKD
ncbi:MAG: sensor histidine kinase [Bacillota bacterium]|nr:sensor histidine kinase [Bacillota bacterium]